MADKMLGIDLNFLLLPLLLLDLMEVLVDVELVTAVNSAHARPHPI